MLGQLQLAHIFGMKQKQYNLNMNIKKAVDLFFISCLFVFILFIKSSDKSKNERYAWKYNDAHYNG